MRMADCICPASARAATSSRPTDEFTIACPLPPVATMVPEITVPPLPCCAGNALLVGAPTDKTRMGKSAPGGRALPGFGADAPAVAAPLVAGVLVACPAGAAVAVRFSEPPCVTVCAVCATLLLDTFPGRPVAAGATVVVAAGA